MAALGVQKNYSEVPVSLFISRGLREEHNCISAVCFFSAVVAVRQIRARNVVPANGILITVNYTQLIRKVRSRLIAFSFVAVISYLFEGHSVSVSR